MDFVSNQMPQGLDQLSPSAQICDFARWRNEISDASERAAVMAKNLLDLGNELFGAEPEAVSPIAGRSEPHCQVAALDAIIEQLRCNLTDLEGRFRRLRRLA